MLDEDAATSRWRALLTGEDPSLRKVRNFWRHLPAAPRCKVCASPAHGFGGLVARLLWHGPSRGNPLLCKACFKQLSGHPGGAEVEISVVFADVRGSTALAERSTAAGFRGLIQDYYRSAAAAIDANGGIIDKFLGDGVMALFIPVITGENHAGRAIKAGREILAAVERDGLARKGLMVGAGVHTGAAFVGVVGSDEKLDFTALGDTVNIAARLGASAGSGELLVSRVTARRPRSARWRSPGGPAGWRSCRWMRLRQPRSRARSSRRAGSVAATGLREPRRPPHHPLPGS